MTGRAGLDSKRSWVVWVAGVVAYVVAVAQRTSFGVAGLDATERFNASASVLATFSVVQLVVYAGLQIPVGMLVDRWGPRAMIAGGAILMAVGQALLAAADSVPAGLVGRFFVGAGDAMTFVSVIRLLPAWFSGFRIPMLTQLTGMVGQLGQLLSLVPFVALLRIGGWTTAFLSLSALSVFALCLAVLAVRNRPGPAAPRGLARAPGPSMLGMLGDAWREPGTRLGFWTHHTTAFSGNVFLLTWGYPFLVSGQGVAPAVASALMSLFVVVALVAGPLIGGATSRYPMHRSTLAFAIIAALAAGWLVVLAWPGAAPVWLLAVLVVLVGIGGPGSMIGFDFARTFNPPQVVGTATGIVNVGGFLGALVSVFAIGAILDLFRAASGSTAELYTLDAFRWALSFQFLPLLVGVAGMAGSRKKARAALAAQGIVVPPLRLSLRRRSAPGD